MAQTGAKKPWHELSREERRRLAPPIWQRPSPSQAEIAAAREVPRSDAKGAAAASEVPHGGGASTSPRADANAPAGFDGGSKTALPTLPALPARFTIGLILGRSGSGKTSALRAKFGAPPPARAWVAPASKKPKKEREPLPLKAAKKREAQVAQPQPSKKVKAAHGGDNHTGSGCVRVTRAGARAGAA